MAPTRVIGCVLLVIGVVLLYFGYQSAQGLDDQITEALTGQYTDDTRIYWISGGVLLVLGAILVVTGRR